MAKQPARGHKKRRTLAPPSRRAPSGATARGRAAKTKRRAGYTRNDQARARATRRGGPEEKRRRRFAPADRVYHLVSTDGFVKSTNDGFEQIGPAADARTICCDKPIGDVFAVATSKTSFDPPVTNWCAGVK